MFEKDKKDKQPVEDKWDAIELDITTIVIELEYDKKLTKFCRAYNEGIKAKDKKTVIDNVQIIVDWFLVEKNEEKLNQIIEVLGKIAKYNIELIACAIDTFLKMVDSKDEDTKFRAIKGLGEVTVQRPDWAYMVIDKLVQLSNYDENEMARKMVLMELSRVVKSNPAMLIEHLEQIFNLLNDQDKKIKMMAIFIIENMKKVLPPEDYEFFKKIKRGKRNFY